MKYKIILFVFIIMSLLGCRKSDNRGISGKSYNIVARKCNYAWAFNMRLKKVNIPNTNSNNKVVFMVKGVGSKDSVNISNYIISVTTANYGLSVIDSLFNTTGYSKYILSGEAVDYEVFPYKKLGLKKVDKSDPILVNKIRYYLKKNLEDKENNIFTRSSNMFSLFTVTITYGISELKNIKITCSENLGGINAGSDISDLLVLTECDNNFIVAPNGKIIGGEQVKNISIKQFLSYNPMVPPRFNLMFRKDIGIVSPLKLRFFIELYTGEGAIVKANTPLIKLLPDKNV